MGECENFQKESELFFKSPDRFLAAKDFQILLVVNYRLVDARVTRRKCCSLWGKAEQTDRAGHVHPLIPLTHIDVYYIDCDGQLVLEPLESEEMCMEKKLTSSPRVNQAETVVFKLFNITIELCVNPSFTQLRRASTIKKNQ